MDTDIRLHNALFALSCLENLACFYSDTKQMPPPDFGYGLSVILGYIKKDITAVYKEHTKPQKDKL